MTRFAAILWHGRSRVTDIGCPASYLLQISYPISH
jgi:hypothetical protein